MINNSLQTRSLSLLSRVPTVLEPIASLVGTRRITFCSIEIHQVRSEFFVNSSAGKKFTNMLFLFALKR